MGLFDVFKTLFGSDTEKKTGKKIKKKTTRKYSKPKKKTQKKIVKKKPRKKVVQKKSTKKSIKKTKRKINKLVKVKKSKKVPKDKLQRKTNKTAPKHTSKKKPKKSKERKNKILRSAQDNSTKSAKGGQVSFKKEVGIITHYFGKISVGIIKLKSELKVGDKIQIKGVSDDFKQTIKSMQYNHVDISLAKKGYEIGIKVAKLVHENDKVYKITD